MVSLLNTFGSYLRTQHWLRAEAAIEKLSGRAVREIQRLILQVAPTGHRSLSLCPAGGSPYPVVLSDYQADSRGNRIRVSNSCGGVWAGSFRYTSYATPVAWCPCSFIHSESAW